MRELLLIGALAGVVQAEGIAWQANLEKAKEKAAVEGKLLFIDIYADW